MKGQCPDDIDTTSCYCEAVDVHPDPWMCPPCRMRGAYAAEWKALDDQEKIAAFSYRRKILAGATIPRFQHDYINFLHLKYPEFSIGSIS